MSGHATSEYAQASFQQKGYYLSGLPGAKGKTDLSLFIGNSGIGLFYLSLLDPKLLPDILAPKIPDVLQKHAPLASYQKYPHIAISQQQLCELFMEKYFKRSANFLNQLKAKKPKECFCSKGLSKGQSNNPPNDLTISQSCHQWIKNRIITLPTAQQPLAMDLYKLEATKEHVDSRIKSYALISIKQKVLSMRSQELLQTDDEHLLNTSLIIDRDIHLYSTHWHWKFPIKQRINENVEQPSYFLFKPKVHLTDEIPLSKYSFLVFQAFKQATKVSSAIKKTVALFGVNDQQAIDAIQEKTLEQIKQGIMANILTRYKAPIR